MRKCSLILITLSLGPLDGELRRDGPIMVLGRQPDLTDPADRAVVAEALTAVDL